MDEESLQFWGIGCRMSELPASVLRIQLRKLSSIIDNMHSFKNELNEIISSYSMVKTRKIEDPNGNSGAFLKLIFESHDLAGGFKSGLIENGIKVKE